MQAALRKMGNSTGVILPRAILGEIGLSVGASIDLRVEAGKLIGTPVASESRTGWANAAASIAAASIAGDAIDDEQAWRGFGNEEDRDIIW